MLPPLIRRAGQSNRYTADPRANGLRAKSLRSKNARLKNVRSMDPRANERGVTIALVATAMVAMISMAALSIDIGTLYQAKAEAQRTADVAALTAARVISISGITGDPNNISGAWTTTCGGPASTATLAALAIAQSSQNFVAGAAAGSVVVNYGAGSTPGTTNSCVGVSNFAVNPVVTVTVKQSNLPIFFARVFSLVGGNPTSTSMSGTASAEAFNPSGSGSVSGMVPVQPRCVKPWIVPNSDPQHLTAGGFVNTSAGTISSQGVWPNGVIDESFTLTSTCNPASGVCNLGSNPPVAPGGGLLQYVPGAVTGTPGAIPACATDPYQEAIAGCDQSTVYACGTPLGAEVDLSENPIRTPPSTGDTASGIECLTNLAANGTVGGPADELVAATYPFQIEAGSSNPLVNPGGVVPYQAPITVSNSIVTIPIYDSSIGPLGPNSKVTIVGFLQVFINQLNADGSFNVTVMNVAGCGNNAANAPVSGTSPVPVRLITPP